MAEVAGPTQGEQRLAYLWTIARSMFVPNPPLSRFYVLQLRKVAADLGLALPAEVLNNICERCSSILIPGVNSAVRVESTHAHERAPRADQHRGTVNEAVLKYVKAKEAKKKQKKRTVPATLVERHCSVCEHTTAWPGTSVGALTRKLEQWKLKEEREHRHVELPNVPPAEITTDFISLNVKNPAWQLPTVEPVVKSRAPGTAGAAVHHGPRGGSASGRKHNRDGSTAPTESATAAAATTAAATGGQGGKAIGQKRGAPGGAGDAGASAAKVPATTPQSLRPPPSLAAAAAVSTPKAAAKPFGTPGGAKTPFASPAPAGTPSTPVVGTPGSKKHTLKSILLKEEQKKSQHKAGGSGSLYDFLSSLGPSPS